MRTLAAVLLVAAALLPARPADACLFAIPTLESVANGMDGRTGVPTNVLMPAGPGLHADASVWLRRAASEQVVLLEVVSDGGVTRLRPPELLAPDSDYEALVFDQPTLPTLGEGESLDDHAVAIARFRTGSGPDEEAPAVPTILRTETQEVWPELPLLGTDSCGPPRGGGTWARFFVEPDADALFYRLERGNPSTIVERKFLQDDDEELFLSEIARGVGGLQAYRIAAIDLAGNESVTPEQAMWLGCPGTCAAGDPMPLALVLGLLAVRLRRRVPRR